MMFFEVILLAKGSFKLVGLMYLAYLGKSELFWPGY